MFALYKNVHNIALRVTYAISGEGDRNLQDHLCQRLIQEKRLFYVKSLHFS